MAYSIMELVAQFGWLILYAGIPAIIIFFVLKKNTIGKRDVLWVKITLAFLRILICLFVFFIISFIFAMWQKDIWESRTRAESIRREDEYERQRAENCDWKALNRIMQEQIVPFSLKSYESYARQFVDRGVRPCDWLDRITGGLEGKNPRQLEQEGLLKNLSFYNSGLIGNYSFGLSDYQLSRVMENVYSGMGRLCVPNTGNGCTFADQKFAIILINNNLEILKKQEFNFPKTANGPFVFNISPSRWFLFTTDLSTCTFVDVDDQAGKPVFVNKKCNFENEKLVYPS